MHSNNILLTKSGLAQLTDFGVFDEVMKCCYGKLSDRSDVMYVAPEVHMGITDPKSDVWSLGVLLYELAEGKNPYAQYDASEVKGHIQYDDPLSLSPVKWPADFVGFVKRCWATRVVDRPSVKELMRVVIREENHS